MEGDNLTTTLTLKQIFESWLDSCVRNKRLSRNTIAVGMVVLDHLRQKCPVVKGDVMSEGGELRGSRAGLGTVLERYGIPKKFLKEATTRQAHQDAQRLFEMYQWGDALKDLGGDKKDKLLMTLIDILKTKAQEWLNRPNFKLEIDRHDSPTTWIHLILDKSKGLSGGVVEQHLVGAKLQKRHENCPIPNHPAHAADVQTERLGDFSIHDVVYHVTAAPSQTVIQKCVANIRAGKHPILLVPQDKKAATIGFAELDHLENQITVISIEDFIAVNIIEISVGEKTDFIQTLKDIVELYNKRLAEVETDMSLRIEIP
jgi:hypothetical protein